MSKKMMSGTGLVKYMIDYDKQLFGINLSGKSAEGNFRNDASILFYVSNNYRQSYYILEKELDNCFNERVNARELSHIVLPLLFNFRHYVELEIKALIVALTSESPRVTHELDVLFNDLREVLNIEYARYSDNVLKNSLDSLINNIVEPLNELIDCYISSEPAVEYYRYIFETQKDNNEKRLVLNNPIITIDFKELKELFNGIISLFNNIRLELNKMDYFVYYFN